MADIAKLGIEIDASQVRQATDAMRTFATTASTGAIQAERELERWEARLQQVPAALARVQANVDKFNNSKLVSPKVVDLDAQQQTAQTRELEAATRRRTEANTKLNQLLNEQAARERQLTIAIEGTDKSTKSIAKSIAGAAISMADLGPAGNAAGNALQAILTGAGPVAIGFAAIAASVSFATGRINEAINKQKELRAILDADIDRKQGLVKVNQDIETNIRLLKAADPELEKIKVQYEEVSKTARGALVVEQNASQQRDLQIRKLADERAAAIAKEQQVVQNQITAADFRLAKLGQTGDALIRLNLAETVHNNSLDAALQKNSALANELDRRAIAEANVQRAQNFVQTGQQGRFDFQQQFGVVFDFDRQIAGQQLADKFAATFNTFKNDPRAATQLQDAFKTLVEQGISSGVPDLPELLVNKLGAGNFERLRAGLDQDLKSALDSTAEAGQQWGDVFDQEFKRYTVSAAEVGVRTEELRQKMAELENSVVRDLALSLDVNQPLSAVAQVQAGLDAIPNYTVKYVEIRTLASGSPTMGFSEYFSNYVPGKINDLSKLSPEVVLSVPGASEKLAELRRLSQKSLEINSEGRNVDDRIAAQAVVRRRADEINLELGAEIARAAQQQQQQQNQATGNNSGQRTTAAPSVVNVNLDMRGANINHEFLDRDLLPQIEKAIKNATGRDITYTVQN
jgi:hypothetical protein